VSTASLEDRKPLPLPGGDGKVLLHSCCAPRSGKAMKAMLELRIDSAIFANRSGSAGCMTAGTARR
jgi:hypothetical protein